MAVRSPRTFDASLILVWSVLAAGGCASAPATKIADAAEQAAAPADDAAASQAERYAQQIAAAMKGGANEAAPDVTWLEPGSDVPEATLQPGKAPEPAKPAKPVAKAEPAPQPNPAVVPVAAAPTTRADLLARLRETLAASHDPAVRKALDAATLSVLDPAGGFDRTALETLGYEQQDSVERYLQAVAMMYAEVAKGESELDRRAIDARLDELFGHQPVRIRTVHLARRVSGYGVYEPFESQTFLAGREQKAIVYVELDHFRPSETDNGFEVRLRQEVTLYNESDGLAVWRSEPVEIVDESRNRRRDFFLVQLVTLPQRMTVGKFRLKVSITDLHGGSVDETSLPVEYVADQSLVKNDAKPR